MANRKRLKKTLKYVASELITDVYFRTLVSGKIDEEKVNGLVTEIVLLQDSFVLRANRPDGKNNPKLVKAYYRSLYADWQKKMNEIIKKIEEL
jgi:hypothetical protein